MVVRSYVVVEQYRWKCPRCGNVLEFDNYLELCLCPPCFRETGKETPMYPISVPLLQPVEADLDGIRQRWRDAYIAARRAR